MSTSCRWQNSRQSCTNWPKMIHIREKSFFLRPQPLFPCEKLILEAILDKFVRTKFFLFWALPQQQISRDHAKFLFPLMRHSLLLIGPSHVQLNQSERSDDFVMISTPLFSALGIGRLNFNWLWLRINICLAYSQTDSHRSTLCPYLTMCTLFSWALCCQLRNRDTNPCFKHMPFNILCFLVEITSEHFNFKSVWFSIFC